MFTYFFIYFCIHFKNHGAPWRPRGPTRQVLPEATIISSLPDTVYKGSPSREEVECIEGNGNQTAQQISRLLRLLIKCLPRCLISLV